MKISICIPCYEMGGQGPSLLKRSFNQIINQTYKDIEIIVSDHSVDDGVKKICDEYSFKLNVVYIKNPIDRGNFSSNLNNSIRNASGEIIKLLMQDDYFMETNTLESIAQIFKDPSVNWAASGCHSGWDNRDYNTLIPRYDDSSISLGINTIGSPSVISIRNKDVQFFDEGLSWVVDLDYYKKMHSVFGEPCILKEYSVFVQRHPNQITNTLADQIKIMEELELRRRYA
jgi:glycosyltransferase involved in cell wall biosynthesis